MVEIPPDGYKRMKNSRKMQMVFFVHEGKVTVDIEDVQFGMTKGGVWQVPRGEFFPSSFLLPLSVCIIPPSSCFGILRRNSGQRCLLHRNMHQQADHARFNTHRLCQGNIRDHLPRQHTGRCQNRVFCCGTYDGSPLKTVPRQMSQTWGTAIYATHGIGIFYP